MRFGSFPAFETTPTNGIRVGSPVGQPSRKGHSRALHPELNCVGECVLAASRRFGQEMLGSKNVSDSIESRQGLRLWPDEWDKIVDPGALPDPPDPDPPRRRLI